MKYLLYYPVYFRINKLKYLFNKDANTHKVKFIKEIETKNFLRVGSSMDIPLVKTEIIHTDYSMAKETRIAYLDHYVFPMFHSLKKQQDKMNAVIMKMEKKGWTYELD